MVFCYRSSYSTRRAIGSAGFFLGELARLESEAIVTCVTDATDFAGVETQRAGGPLGRLVMQKLAYAVTIAASGLFVGTALAAPVTIGTTQSSVQKQCGNKLGCSTACGSTSCDYECKKGKCTVTINLAGAGGKNTATGVNATQQMR